MSVKRPNVGPAPKTGGEDALDRLGHFRISGRVGEGGMGIVYLAEDERLRRTVAIKVLRKDLSDDRERRSRFLREARLAASINHSAIAAIYEVGESDERAFIAMEYVAGSPLRNVLAEAQPNGLAVAEALRIAREVARGLAVAHEAGIVHRDLKPENVIVGADGVVKLLDFGIAKLMDEDPSAPDESTELNTRKGSVLGTPAYMSPEQAVGKSVDARSDVFSLGAVMYEALVGRRPFGGDTWQEMIVSITRDEPESPSDLPVPVIAMVLRCLAKRPEDRFANARHLVAAIDNCLSDTAGLTDSSNRVAQVEPPSVRPTEARTVSVSPTATADTAKAERGRSLIGRALLGAVAVSALGYGIYVLVPRAEAPVDPQSSSEDQPLALRYTDREVSANPAAKATLVEAWQAFRDGSNSRAKRSFVRAAELDPSLSQAHLWASLLTLQTDPKKGREYYQKAVAHRHKLNAFEQAMLDASEPYFRQPTDLLEWEKRLTAVVEAHPAEPTALFYLGVSQHLKGDFARALATYRKVTELDARFATAYVTIAQVTGMLDDVDGTLDALARCIEVSPSASSCLATRRSIASELGQCEQAISDTRELIAIDPEEPGNYYQLAAALHAQQSPLAAVRAALEMRWELGLKEEQVDRRGWDLARLSITTGDFEGAVRELVALQEAHKNDPDLSTHVDMAAWLCSLHLEMGDPKAANELADVLLAKSTALTRTPFGVDSSVAMNACKLRAGSMTSEAFGTLRDAWVEQLMSDWKKQEKVIPAGFFWVELHAQLVVDEETAKAAVSRQKEFLPMPTTVLGSASRHQMVGRAFAMAGRADEAIAELRPAITSCLEFDDPLAYTEARFWYGVALEASGDAAGAKQAYQSVVTRWGNAKPRSVTAERAKKRLDGLVAAPSK